MESTVFETLEYVINLYFICKSLSKWTALIFLLEGSCCTFQTFCILFLQRYAMNKRGKGKSCNPKVEHLYYPTPFRGLSAILLKCWGSATSLWSQPCEWENQWIHLQPRPERQQEGTNGEVPYMTKSESFGFSYIVVRLFSLFQCFQKPFMPDKMKCQTWQLTRKHFMYILLNSVSLDYKLLRAETLSCNCVTCAISIYEYLKELVIIIIMCDATDGFNGE